MLNRLARIRHVALDMDGTIYQGSTVFECTAPFLEQLRELGIGFSFLTNNPSRSRAEYLQHLLEMGIPAAADQLFTSTDATIAGLKDEWREVRRLFVLGTGGLNDELRCAGYELTPDDPSAVPDAVVVGFDQTLTYARLCRAAWWISRGKPYFCTNPDRVCPTNQPTVLVDCGAITAALQAATGCDPKAVFGKPDPAMLRGLLHRYGLEPAQLAMVGDRLYTDMALAHRAGVLGVLVLTGETTAAAAAVAQPAPDLVVANLAELGEQLDAARQPQRSP